MEKGIVKPHIKKQYYAKSKRSYWKVSSVEFTHLKKWNRLTREQKSNWHLAHMFKEAMNAKRVVCPHCGKE